MVEREHRDVETLALQRNEGGAGGFHEGMKQAHARGAEWMWLMDDDTVPEPDAPAELLSASARCRTAGEPSGPTLLASRVIWRDGSAHPLNFPTLERRRMDLVIAGAQQGLLPMRAATFVSLLVHRRAIDKYHLPLKHYFLWSDDIEYTSRVVLGGERAWFVPSSVALHDTSASNSTAALALPRHSQRQRHQHDQHREHRDQPNGDRSRRDHLPGESDL
jgi:GT2 family glycosyltransferase